MSTYLIIEIINLANSRKIMHLRFGYGSLFAAIILSGTALLFAASRSDALPTISPKPENSMLVGTANNKAIELHLVQ
jgi:hypothetical protein